MSSDFQGAKCGTWERRLKRQGEAFVTGSDLAKSPGHSFYKGPEPPAGKYALVEKRVLFAAKNRSSGRWAFSFGFSFSADERV